MKKSFNLMSYLLGLLLSIGLSACSYQAIQPEEVQQEQENPLSERLRSKKESSVEASLSQESEMLKKEAETAKKEPEQERYSTEQPAKKTSEQASELASQQENTEQENKEQESKQQKNKQAGAQVETIDSQASPLMILPEELDDGSEGELSNSANKALNSDQEKAGNSNINRKGRDTYLMEEGKPKRFWNLQRQL